MIRSTDDLLAEAKKAEQDNPNAKEPFQLRLADDTVVTFCDPGDVPADQGTRGGQSTRDLIDSLILDAGERRAFWNEWGKLKTKYVANLFYAIGDHYNRGVEGKDVVSFTSSSGSPTPSRETSTPTSG